MAYPPTTKPSQSHEKPRTLGIGLTVICLLLAVISLLHFQMDNFADDPGVGWHLMTGQLVSQQKAAPQVDPFLFSNSPRAWVSDQWLSDVGLYQIFRLTSWPGLYAFLTALYLVIYFGILLHGLRHSEKDASYLASLAGILVAFKAGQIHFILRPVMVSFLFFAIVYVRLLRSWHFRLRAWDLVLLPGIFLLWANMHPAFALGLLLMGLWLVGSFIDQLYNKNFATSWYVLLLLTLVCFAATLLNPYGWSLHQSILSLGSSSYFMRLHDEWQPLSFVSPEGNLVALALAILVISLILRPTTAREMGVRVWVPFILFLCAAVNTVRMVPFWGIAASYPLLFVLQRVGLSKIFHTSPACRRLARAFHWLEERERRAFSEPVMTGIIVVFILISGMWGGLPFYDKAYGPSAKRYPYDAVNFIEKTVAASPLVVAAPPEWGGFITLQGQGKLKAIIDDRNTLLGESFFQRFYDGLDGKQDIVVVSSQLGAKVLLLPKNSLSVSQVRRQHPEISTLYEDSQTVAFSLVSADSSSAN